MRHGRTFKAEIFNNQFFPCGLCGQWGEFILISDISESQAKPYR